MTCLHRSTQSHPSPAIQAASPHHWLAYLARAVISVLAPDNGPKISCRTLPGGEVRWKVYDPVSGQVSVCRSEADVRVCLEALYSL